MNWMRARSRRAPRSQWTAKRAPEILAARSKSRMPSSGPRSQCAFGVKSKLARLPDPPDLDVRGVVRAHRHARVGHVRNDEQEAFGAPPPPPASRASPSLIRSATPFISALSSDASSFALPRRAISSPTLRCSVAQLLDLLDERAALGVEGPGVDPGEAGQGLHLARGSCPRRGEHLEDLLAVLHDVLQVQHGRGEDSTAAPARSGGAVVASRPMIPAEGPQGGLSGRRARHPLSPRHEGAAQGDAGPRRQAHHPVRDRGGGGLGPHHHHHRDRQGQEHHRGPLRRLLRARAAPRAARPDRACSSRSGRSPA